jgi:serine/threonine-protein kinase
MPDLLGRALAHFRIVRKLGEGGMGVVYEATDERLRRAVALKVLLELSDEGDDRRQRLLREARAAAAVTHANIATVYEIGEADGRVFIAMELVEGRSLRLAMKGGMPIAESLRIARAVAQGLGRAHDKGIVHRDLKPENVMVTPHGDVKILDFGIAKLHSSTTTTALLGEPRTEQQLTVDGMLLGTPAYMSPEQAHSEPVDARSDVFSFGVMLYEMLAGARPFRGETAIALLLATTTKDPEPVERMNPAVPADVARVVARCLEKRREDRYPNARRVAEALGVMSSDAGSSGPSLRPPQAATSPAALSVVTPQVSSVTTRPPRARSRWWLLAAAVFVVALAALAVAGALMRVPAVPAPPPASAPAPTAPRVVRLIDLPPPASTKPEALAAYAQGIRERYDGVNSSYASFRRAFELDPTMGAAALRTVEVFVGVKEVHSARPSYRALLSVRDRLSDRDRDLTWAFEPIMVREPPDWGEGLRRLREVHAKHPADAGVALDLVLALIVGQPDASTLREGRGIAEEVRRSDPGYAFGAFALAQIAVIENRLGDAERVSTECLQASPRSDSCYDALISAQSLEGQCAAVLESAHRWAAVSPQDSEPYRYALNAIVATGEPGEAVDAAEDRMLAVFPEGTQVPRRAGMGAVLALIRGDFGEGGRLLAKLDHRSVTAGSRSAGQEFTPVAFRVRLQVLAEREGGEGAAAASRARQYMRRRDAYVPTDLDDDVVPFMLAEERAGGLVTRQEVDSEMEGWRRGWRAQLGVDTLPPVAWVVGDAAVVATREEALAALSSGPPVSSLLVDYDAFVDPTMPATVGHVLLLAERFDEAARLLEEVANFCQPLNAPFTPTLAAFDLGMAREALGQKEAACAAYGTVVARWGHAKPRSVTAEKAAERAKALGCGR